MKPSIITCRMGTAAGWSPIRRERSIPRSERVMDWPDASPTSRTMAKWRLEPRKTPGGRRWGLGSGWFHLRT